MGITKGALGLALALFLAQSANAWATGAIAVDDEPGGKPSEAGYGIGFGDDKDSAMKSAMKKCKEAGNDNCSVKVWFEGCGAYASSKKYYGHGLGASASQAAQAALNDCNDNSCKVVVTDCVGDRALDPHRANLFDMGQKYSDLMRSSELRAILEKRAA